MFKRNFKLVFRLSIASFAIVLSALVFADITPRDSIDKHYASTCPNLWKGLKYTISEPGHTAKPPWANAADKNEFVDYLRTYLIQSTLPTANSDRLSDDALTVASECIKRRNAVVDRDFNRYINSDIDYALRFQALLPILVQYTELSRQAITLETARLEKERVEQERLRRARIMTSISARYLLMLQTL